MLSKVSTSAQIIYYCSISPGSIPGIVIYILSIGRSYGVELHRDIDKYIYL
jgi:hypothetical protein